MSMEDIFDIYDFDVVCDIDGNEFIDNVDEMITLIENSYSNELNDTDEAPLVYIGLAVKLNKKGVKLPEKLKEKVIKSLNNKHFIARLKENEEYYSGYKKWRQNFIRCIETNITTEEKKYVSPFVNWRKGDVFVLDVFDDHYVILNVLQVEMEKGKYYPHVHMSFIPEFKKPNKIDEVKGSVFLPSSRRFEHLGKYDYRYKIINDFFKISIEMPIEYLGNKPISAPEDEYITEGVWESRLIIRKEMVNDVNIGVSIINKTQRQTKLK